MKAFNLQTNEFGQCKLHIELFDVNFPNTQTVQEALDIQIAKLEKTKGNCKHMSRPIDKTIQVSLDKPYKTINGAKVRLYAIEKDSIHGAVYSSTTDSWVSFSWKAVNGLYIQNDSFSSLTEIIPFADFKIDDKVLIWTKGGDKHKGHFAGVDDKNRPMVYRNGRTSFTGSNAVAWDYCIHFTTKEDIDNEE